MAAEVTDQNFEAEILNYEGVALVDFWAPWCGPCRTVGPIIDELASEYGDTAKIVKMNVDENSETPGKYGVMSIPTMIIFKNGEKVDQAIGVQEKDALKEKIDGHMAG